MPAPTLMTYQYLLDTQSSTAWHTAQEYHGMAMNMPRVLDTLFQLSHMHRFQPDETVFVFWAQNALWGAPYTASDIYALWLRGSYLEAVILLRHLVEVLVQLRFYNDHREAYLSHLRYDMRRRGAPLPPNGPRPQRPVLRTMFEAVAPGFYDDHYGPHFSNTAHGGLMSTVFRSESVPGVEQVHQHVPGAHYSMRNASNLLTYFLPVLHGLLRIHSVLPPAIPDQSDTAARERIDDVLNWVRQAIQADWDEFPNKRRVLTQLQPLAAWSPTT